MGKIVDIWTERDVDTGEKYDPFGIEAEIASRKYKTWERLFGKPDRDRERLLDEVSRDSGIHRSIL